MVNMKKISIIALTILTLGMTSCDMDKMPYDAVPTEEALTTIVGFVRGEKRCVSKFGRSENI